MPVTIVTDSTCDLPREMLLERGIYVVPLTVMFGTQTYLDGVTLDNRTFFDKLAHSGVHPSSSQPTPEEFLKTYRQIPGEIFSIHLSAALSGTCNSALQATRLMGQEASRVRVHDSDITTLGLGLLVLAAQEAAAEGLDLDGIQARVQALREDLRVLFTVTTLDYLVRGGRIGRAQALLGGLLKVRPILSYENHAVMSPAKAFGFDQALAKILAMAAEDHARKPIRRLFVAHGANPEAADRLEGMVRERLGSGIEILRSEIGAVIGTHVGPGCAGIMYHA